MSDKLVFQLSHDAARQNAAQAVIQAPDGHFVILQPRTRTLEQNARYWGRGILAQIAEKATVNGQKFSAEAWHELFKRKFIGLIELPGGEVVGQSSKDLSTKRFSTFVDEVEAYAVTDLGVVFEDWYA